MLSAIAARVDSWMNSALGFGGAEDKIRKTKYATCVQPLTDAQLTAMYRTEHLSAKIVDVYPREAYREGFEVSGYEREEHDDGDDVEEQVCAYLRAWDLVRVARNASIWARLYGGAAVWLGSASTDPAKPFVLGEKIDFLRVVDRRYLSPRPWALDKQGKPTLYDVIPDEGGAQVGPVHASRLIMWPGAFTDARSRRELNWWDDSVLQRPFYALQSDGLVWNAAEQMISEASLGILRVKGLLSQVSNATARAQLSERLAFFRQTRSISKNLTLDFDQEDYKRDTLSFAGVSDLTQQSVQRVASAAEMPVSILMSDEPAGLNATGDSSIRWWLMRVHAYRTGDLEPPTLALTRAVLAQSGIGAVSRDNAMGLALKWPPLWTPSASEQAEIRSKNSAADKSDIDAGILTAEEAALSHYGEDGYSQDIRIDRALREPPSEAELARALESGAGGATGPTGNAGPTDAPAGEDIQKQALNGAQVASLVDIVSQVAAETIPRDAAVEIVQLAFQVDATTADKLIGTAGKGFKAAKPEPPAPFGGGGGAPPFGKPPPKPGAEPKAPEDDTAAKAE